MPDAADLSSDELRDAISNARIEAALDRQRSVFEKALERPREPKVEPGGQPGDGTATAAPAASSSDFDLTIDESQFEPWVVNLINEVKAHRAQLKALQELANQVSQVQQQNIAASLSQICDQFFSEHADIFGKGSFNELDPDSWETAKRSWFIAQVKKDNKQGQPRKRLNETFARLFPKGKKAPEPAVPVAEPKTDFEKDWLDAGLARPTSRTGGAEPQEANGTQKAVEEVTAYLKENRGGAKEQPTTVDEFL